MRFVVIGGDAAGMSAASRAKRLAPDLEVTVLEQTRDVSYSACGMPYNIADPFRSIDDLVVRSADVFRKKAGIDLRLGHRAARVDAVNRTVAGTTDRAEDFEISFDYLLLATGATPIIPDLPGFDLAGVMALKSLEQGRRIKDFIKANSVRRAVIIGMGYIGLEMCEALRAQDIEVEMVKPRPDLLPWMDRKLAADVEEVLKKNKVRLHLGRTVSAIERSGDGLKVLDTDASVIGVADMALVAVGVRPASELAIACGLQSGPGGAIAVDRRMRTSNDRIYAAGDCADAFHVVTGKRVWIPLALRANRAGWAAADHICGKPVDIPGVVGTEVFKAFDLQVARTGLTIREAAEAGFDPQSVTITTRSRAHAHPGSSSIQVHMVGDRQRGLLLGVQMVGTESVAHRINAAAVALHAAMTVEQFSQCDLSYAPPFGPVWDPLLVAANQLLKVL